MVTRNAASMGTYGATWETRGYSGQGNVSDLIDSIRSRSAIIAGNGSTVFNDIDRALALLGEEPVIFAVNDVGMFLPKIDHWVSLHADNLKAWRDVRWLQSRPAENTQLHSIDQKAFIHYVWEQLTPLMALSGYFAMQIAYIMGAERIILCGCPGMRQRRFFEWEPKEFGYGSGDTTSDNGIREQLFREMERLPEFKKIVRSMSGWTKEYFGGLRRD